MANRANSLPDLKKEKERQRRIIEGISQYESHREKGIIPNLISFCRILKDLQLDITPGKIIDAGKGLKVIDFQRRDDFYYTLRANLVSRREDLPIFKEVFDLFWRELTFKEEKALSYPDTAKKGEPSEGKDEESFRQEIKKEIVSIENLSSEKEEDAQEEPIPGYSPMEVLRYKDFSSFSEDELERIKKALSEIAPKIATKKTRRYKPAEDGRIVDFRRTFRQNLQFGGEIIEIRGKKKKILKTRLILLCDVSGSMDCYSRFLIEFIFGFQNYLKGVETFVFATRLSKITGELKKWSFDEALSHVSDKVLDWSGGTNIGLSLEAFNSHYSKGLLSKKTVVVIISDGWDRGDSRVLQREMQRLKNRSYKVLWLNPLLGSASYEPTCKGMNAALPYVDFFLPVHNLDSLIKAGKTLKTLL